ncbi:hypothetical protein [Halodesulfovibrio aestuarii]|uniref:Uncharacterized protein n=1 Tax=Halodesulfovibrio aestuarii TaxID=126333 RepID=A0ABV4JZ10_9BACT
MNRLKVILIFVILFVSVSYSYGASITPEQLVQSFNLRTIYSSYADTLRMYCGDYPSDFFVKEHIKITSKSAILESKNRYLKLEILDENLIEVTDIIKGRSYSAKCQYSVSFDEKHQDIRASQTYVEEIGICLPYPEALKRDWGEE